MNNESPFSISTVRGIAGKGRILSFYETDQNDNMDVADESGLQGFKPLQFRLCKMLPNLSRIIMFGRKEIYSVTGRP